MKLYPNRDSVMLYVRSMGKALRVTAIFDNEAQANKYMGKHDDAAVVAVSGRLIFIADRYDPGTHISDSPKGDRT
jgi:hypothetical protein